MIMLKRLSVLCCVGMWLICVSGCSPENEAIKPTMDGPRDPNLKPKAASGGGASQSQTPALGTE
jgi:hypothetical protein